MKKKKTSPKVILLSLLIVALVGGIGFMSYKTFIADAPLKKLGYSYKEIQKLHKYGIDDEVTTYNQSLLYALNSQEFDENNIHYYTIFDSQMDLTRIANALAKSYSVEELRSMKGYMSDEQIESLVDYEKISNLTAFQQILAKQYSVEDSVALANKLSADDLKYFLELYQLTSPQNYLRYLANGYDNETICLLFNKAGDEAFNDLANIRHFDEIYEMVNSDLFKVEMLPRYLMYHRNTTSTTITKSLSQVNSNHDVTTITDYSATYPKNPLTVSEYPDTVLVNKSHKLDSNYMPIGLVDVNADYRYGPATLLPQADESFRQMADKLKEEVGTTILIASGYKSFQSCDTDYSKAITDSLDNPELVDSYAFRAGFDESQTGLAIEVIEKGKTTADFAKSKSAKWLNEHCAEYGFIRRYPENREFLTKINPSAYHFRYVGIEAARIIQRYNWTLEEYSYLFNGD